MEITPTTETTKKKSGVKSFYTISLFAAILIAIAVCYPHNYVENFSAELKAHKKTYKQLIDKRDSTYFALNDQLVTGNLTPTEYTEAFLLAYTTYKKDNKAYNTKKKEIQKADYVIGYTSFKNFLLGIAFPISLLITTLLLFNSKIKELNQDKRRFHLLGYGAMVLNASYWVAWSFLYMSNSRGEYDFEGWQYTLMLYVLPVLVTIGAYFLFRYYKTIEQRLGAIIAILYRPLYKDLQEKELIHPSKEKEFRRYRMKITEEAVGHE